MSGEDEDKIGDGGRGYVAGSDASDTGRDKGKAEWAERDMRGSCSIFGE